ncbi:TPA: hypothetical protein ACGO00_001241 [Streptococcus suis]
MKCATRTNLPINHCAEMLTPTSRSDANLYTYLSLSVDVCQERLACEWDFLPQGHVAADFFYRKTCLQARFIKFF